MEELKRDTIIYSLNVEDLQTVALEEIVRELSQSELLKMGDLAANNLGGYEAIANAIQAENLHSSS